MAFSINVRKLREFLSAQQARGAITLFQEFAQLEAFSGILLIAAAAAARCWCGSMYRCLPLQRPIRGASDEPARS